MYKRQEEDRPHDILGPHLTGEGLLIQAFIPLAVKVFVVTEAGKEIEMEKVDEEGYYAVLIPGKSIIAYHYLAEYADGSRHEWKDSYAFSCALNEKRLEKFCAGIAYDIYEDLGCLLYTSIDEDADYVYICENNTIYGTKFKTLPNTKGKTLVADVSSCFLSEPVDVTKYGVIYGGVQKNIGPAGVVIVIIREDLITEDVLPGTPTMLQYKIHADAESLYNTPPAYGIYICGKVFQWLKKMGGLEVMKERNEKKAKVLYDFLDSSELFKGTVRKEDRSLMNVPFVTGDADLDAKFVKEAKEAGFENLKGHRSVGGMRASIYNAMPIEGVEKLVEFMKKFEAENK